MEIPDRELINKVFATKRQSHSKIMKILAPLNMKFNLKIEDGQILFLDSSSNSDTDENIVYWLDAEEILSVHHVGKLLLFLRNDMNLHIYDLETFELGFWHPIKRDATQDKSSNNDEARNDMYLNKTKTPNASINKLLLSLHHYFHSKFMHRKN